MKKYKQSLQVYGSISDLMLIIFVLLSNRNKIGDYIHASHYRKAILAFNSFEFDSHRIRVVFDQ